MANPVPNNLALSVINTNDTAQSAPLRNNYSAIQTAVNQLIACLSGGTAGQFLQAADGTDVQYAIPSGARLAIGTRAATVTTTGTTFAAGADLLAAALSFTADGTSSYIVNVAAAAWSNNTANAQNVVRLNLDGADGGLMSLYNQTATGGATVPLVAAAYITPAAGAHTVNIRITTGSGTLTVSGGVGGAGVNVPIIVWVEKV